MTQEEQEEQLLARSPEYRKNEMIMLEEFRRRKMHKDLFDMKAEDQREMDDRHNRKDVSLGSSRDEVLAFN